MDVRQQFFRENLRLGDGGETGRYNDLHEQTYTRTGATILGKRISVDGPATPVATVSRCGCQPEPSSARGNVVEVVATLGR
jgi:hypothetical protein